MHQAIIALTAAAITATALSAPLAHASPSQPAPPKVAIKPAPEPRPGSSRNPQPPQAGQVLKDCADCPELVVIPAGEFTMGSPSSEPERGSSEGPQRRVRVSSFLAGRYEVTFAQWDACVAAGGCSHKPSDQGWGRDQRPVVNVSWDDAQQYVKWLSSKTGKGYRLLSEAEWEYVARAGKSTAFWWGPSASHEKANYGNDNCCSGLAQGRDKWVTTAPVGSFDANAFGLHDTAGNAWEWVQDVWHDNYEGAPTDGSAWLSGGYQARRVRRGGSWFIDPIYLRSAIRSGSTPGGRYDDNGFRIARTF